MKKIFALLAVLALVGCEGSGSNNNNPNPDNGNGNGDAGNGNGDAGNGNGNAGNGNGNAGNGNGNAGNGNGNGNTNTIKAIGKWSVGEGVTFAGNVQGIDFTIAANSISQTVKCTGNQTFTVTVKAKVTATQMQILEDKQAGTEVCPAGLGKSTATYTMVDDNNLEINLGEQGILPLVRKR